MECTYWNVMVDDILHSNDEEHWGSSQHSGTEVTTKQLALWLFYHSRVCLFDVGCFIIREFVFPTLNHFLFESHGFKIVSKNKRYSVFTVLRCTTGWVLQNPVKKLQYFTWKSSILQCIRTILILYKLLPVYICFFCFI